MLLAELPDERLEEYLRTTELHKETANTVSDPQVLREQIRAVRAKGYCILDEEIEIGIRAAAVPCAGPRGRRLRSAWLCTPPGIRSAISRPNFVPPLLETGAGLERLLSLRG